VSTVKLVNWPWLEELLVRACELEVRAFGAAHRDERFFAFCLEFNPVDGALGLSYATHDAVEAAVEALRREAATVALPYRSVELRPQYWRYRRQPVQDPEGAWDRAAPVLDAYREALAQEEAPGAREFLWRRFEYLAECVVRALLERDAFSALRLEREFLAYPANEHDRVEAVEDWLAALNPRYRRATMEMVSQPRPRSVRPASCAAEGCESQVTRRGLRRCTYCNHWFCGTCAAEHHHPELLRRQSFLRE
jgi:hypothetical protein